MPTWGTIDANGMTGIASGQYTSYGIGTSAAMGLMDENGKVITAAGCNILQDQKWWVNNQIGADVSGYDPNGADFPGGVVPSDSTNRISLDSVSAALADQFALDYKTAYQTSGPSPLPPPVVPLYCGPPNIYGGLATHLSEIGGGFSMSCGVYGLSSVTDMHRFQAAINAAYKAAGHPLPFLIGEYSNGQDATSSDSPYPPCDRATFNGTGVGDQFLRGKNDMVAFYQAGLALKDPGGYYDDIGNDHSYLYDKSNEGCGTPAQGANFGLVDAVHGNLLDGAASTTCATWATACAANTTYTVGTAQCGCKDANGNYLGVVGLYGSTCTSNAAVAPVDIAGTANYGKVLSGTAFGTCVFDDEGIYVPSAETSTQVGASGHAGSYGNNGLRGVIGPVSDFFLARGSYATWIDTNGVTRTGVCDPASSTTTQTFGFSLQGFFQ